MLTLLRRSSSAKVSDTTAICFHAKRIDVARVRAMKDKPVLEVLESYTRGSDDKDALTRLRKKFRLDKARCSTLLESSEYQVLQMTTPSGTDPEDRATEIRTKLQEMIETPLAHVTYGVIDIPTEKLAPGRSQNSYAVVAGNAGIAPKVRLFHEAKAALKVIDIPEMAQRNVARFGETQDRALALLAFGEFDSLLTFTVNGELFMFRRIEVGLSQLTTDDMDRRSTLFDRIGLEVQRSLDNFDRQYGFVPLSRLMVAQHATAVPLQGYLRDYLAITVDVLDFSEFLDLSAVPELANPDRQGHCFFAIGAALRQEAV